MAKEQTGSKFQPASMNPDEFSTGRADKFTGVWFDTQAFPYKGRNSTDNKYYLNVGVHIIPDEDSGYEPFWESYSGGFLHQAVPSKDGISPAGASDDDYVALSNGKTEGLDVPVQDEHYNVLPNAPYVGPHVLGQLSKGRSWEQATIALRDSDTKGLVDFSKPGYLGFGNGLRCRFDRVPQTNAQAAKKGEKEYKVLVVSEILGRVDMKGVVSSKVSGTSAASSPTNGSESTEDISSLIAAEILSQLKANGGKLEKGKLMSLVPKALLAAGSITKAQKADCMAWIGESNPKNEKIPINLVDIDGTSFDPETQTLELD